MKRWWLLLLPAPLVVVLAAWASARVADHVGATAATALGTIAVLFRAPAVPAAELDDGVIPTELKLVPEVLAAPPVKGRKRGAKVQPSGPPVVFVSRDTVLNLASTGARPRGVPVPATATRPAGLKLLGVAGLGVGLRDGDVLTRALGVPALSSGAVVQAVLAARAKRAPVLEGEFWRESQRFILRVEQPYLPDRHTERAGEEGPRLTMREMRPRLASP